MAKLIASMILLLSFGAQAQMSCLELFSDKSISQDQLQIVAKELHGLRTDMMNAKDHGTYVIAKSQYDSKIQELSAFTSQDAIRDLIRSIKNEVSRKEESKPEEIKRLKEFDIPKYPPALVSTKDIPGLFHPMKLAATTNDFSHLLLENVRKSYHYKIHEVKTGNEVEFVLERGKVNSFGNHRDLWTRNFSKTKKYIYFVSESRFVEIFDLQGEKVFEMEIPDASRTDWKLKFSSDDSQFAVWTVHKYFFLIDLKTKSIKKVETDDHVSDFEFLPDGKIVTAYKWLSIHENSKIIKKIKIDKLDQLTLTQDGRSLIVWTRFYRREDMNESISRVLKINSKSFELELELNMPSEVTSIVASPDGTKAIARVDQQTPDDTIHSHRVYSLVTGDRLSDAPGNFLKYRFIDDNTFGLVKSGELYPDPHKLEIWEWPNE